jgi:hypothetical protein
MLLLAQNPILTFFSSFPPPFSPSRVPFSAFLRWRRLVRFLSVKNRLNGFLLAAVQVSQNLQAILSRLH